MRNYKLNFKRFFLILALFISVITVWSQNSIVSSVSTGFKTGNSALLSQHFNNNVELFLIDKNNICTKSQATTMISSFFKSHIPSNYTTLHEGQKADYFYSIGTLITSAGSFRVYYLIKKQNNIEYIQQIRIENNND